MVLVLRLLAAAAFAGARLINPIMPLSARVSPVASALPRVAPQPGSLALAAPAPGLAPMVPGTISVSPAAPAPAVRRESELVPGTGSDSRSVSRGAAAPRLSGELAVAGASPLFDGSGLARPAAPVAPSAGGFTAAGYLRSTLAEDQGFVDATVLELRRSRAGRDVLRRVARLAEDRGRPVAVELADIRPLGGEFSYDTEVVRLKRSLLRLGPGDAAPVLGHELVHVVQKARGLPSDLFEMELEAYMLDIRITLELGFEYAGSDWDRQVERHFRKGVKDLVDFLLGGLYKDNASVTGLGMQGLIEHVEGQARSEAGRLARLEARLAKRRESAEALRRMGHPPAELKAYRDEEIQPLTLKIREARRTLGWHQADLALLKSPEGRERVLDYARSVMALARRTRRWYLARKPGP